MVSKEYFDTARSLIRIAGKMTDRAITNRLKALAEDYERRAQQSVLVETAEALAQVEARGNTADRSRY